jgi:hypothetical protein
MKKEGRECVQNFLRKLLRKGSQGKPRKGKDGNIQKDFKELVRKEVNGNAVESCRIADFRTGELYV